MAHVVYAVLGLALFGGITGYIPGRIRPKD